MLLIPQLATKRPRTTTTMGAITGRRQRGPAGPAGSDMVWLRWASPPVRRMRRVVSARRIGLGQGIQGGLSRKHAREIVGRRRARGRFTGPTMARGTALSEHGAKRFSVV